MRRLVAAVAGLSILGLMLVVGIPLLMIMAVLGGSGNDPTEGCHDPTTETVQAVGATTTTAAEVGLSDVQRANAAKVVAEGNRLGLPRRALVIALAVAHQESRFLNYANDGKGNDLDWTQLIIDASLELPHDAIGSDHGSLGVFQQQWPWWGSMRELMDPTIASQKFYTALLAVPGWESMPVTVAGQAVQNSAYPDAYADDEAVAEQLLSDPGLAALANVTLASLGAESCTPETTYPGTVVHPLGENVAYIDQANWGSHGANWSNGHTGTDFSAPCGTPVRAATDGIIIIRTDQAWAGRWLVQVTTGVGHLTTWYGHLQALAVTDRQRVTAGTVIGEVGALGNATGCHLHFEVHPKGGSIYEDDIDPTKWLAENVGKALGGILPVSTAETPGQLSLITANVPFNLPLDKAVDQIAYVLQQDPDVVMLQEVPGRNVAKIVDDLPGNWGVWQPSPRSNAESAIVYNADRLSLGLHGAQLLFESPRYDHYMTWAILRTATAEVAVVGLHMPTDASINAEMQGYYLTATMNYQAFITELIDQGYPPIVGGDWNHPLDIEREPWSPVPQLAAIGMTTNWLAGTPCEGTSARNGRIDGFAYHPGHVSLTTQGCLERRHSDHRAVWIAVEPVSTRTE